MMRELKKLLSGKNGRTRLLLVIGAAGIFLILLSEILPEKKQDAEQDISPAGEISVTDTERYRRELEDRLTDILSQVEGVSDVNVMISLSGTQEYVYAEQNDIEQRTDSISESLKRQGEIIIADQSGGKQPVLKKIMTPDIDGAAIVCSGAEDPRVKERVINTASAALGLSTGRISVEEYG